MRDVWRVNRQQKPSDAPLREARRTRRTSALSRAGSLADASEIVQSELTIRRSLRLNRGLERKTK